jgi:hypothetical protein
MLFGPTSAERPADQEHDYRGADERSRIDREQRGR